MEKREKVHHDLANVLLVPRITQHRHRTPHARDTGTPPRRAHDKDTGERTGTENAREPRNTTHNARGRRTRAL